MAAPTNLTLIDDFDRPDGQAWSGAGAAIWGTGVQVSSNSLRTIDNQLGTASGGLNGVTLATFGPAFDMVLDVTAVTSSYFAFWWGLSGAGTASFSGPALVIGLVGGPTTWEFRNYTSGASASIIASTTTAALAPGDRLWVHTDGSNHTAYCARAATPAQWDLVLTGSDGTYDRPGQWGFEFGSGFQRFDNLRGGDVGASTTPVAPPGLSPAGSIGSATLQSTIRLAPPGAGGAGSLGAVAVRPAVRLAPTGIGSAGAVGSAAAVRPVARVAPATVPASSALGGPAVRGRASLSPVAVSSAGAAGTPIVAARVRVVATGIGIPAPAPGVPTVVQPGAASIVVAPAGAASVGSLGATSLRSVVTLGPSGVPSATAGGQPYLRPTLPIAPSAIGTVVAVGAPRVQTVVAMRLTGSAPAGAVGLPLVIGGRVVHSWGVEFSASVRDFADRVARLHEAG